MKHRSLVTGVTVAAACALLASASGTARAQEADRPMEEIRPNPGLLTSGAIVLAASYAPAVLVASTSEHEGDDYLYIPVAGPFLNLATRGCEPGESVNCGSTTLETAALITMGAAHIIGTGQVIASFVAPERRPVVQVGKSVVVTPAAMGRGGYGISAVGRF